MSGESAADALEPLTIVAYTPRDRARAFVRPAFPRRQWRIVIVKDIAEFKGTLCRALVDALLVDVGSMSPGANTVSDGFSG